MLTTSALRHRPIVVLSNNDGNVIARNKEAKALGIAMGAPYFDVKGMLSAHNVVSTQAKEKR